MATGEREIQVGDISSTTKLIQMMGGSKDPAHIYRKLESVARTIGAEKFQKIAAREIVAGTRPDRAIPELYQPYRALVRDGIEFFLSQIPLQRLFNVLVTQLQMDRKHASEERLLELAKQFPTLQKLGQIIARNQNIDPSIKKWLIHLENGKYGTAPDDLVAQIRRRLNLIDGQTTVQINPVILSEASVGAVIPFKLIANDGQDKAGGHGVFKVLKPNIQQKLHEELDIFEKTATYFDKHRYRYALRDFKFLHFFRDVRDILIKEVDLTAEQSHLSQASQFYKNVDDIVIPNLISLSDSTMTAMDHIPGEKITDAPLSKGQKRQCAHILMASLICRPLFAETNGKALFHGDPHAGNILFVASDDSQNARVALLDWSLAGQLSQAVRVEIVRLIQSIVRDEPDLICRCIQSLASCGTSKEDRSLSDLQYFISELMQCNDYAGFSLMKKAFWLLEQLSYEGVVFSSDLLLFRKALFTLEGVLLDLHPEFDMDMFIFNYMASLIKEEIPRRLGSLFFLQEDKPEHYRSLISNNDLHVMALYQYAAAFNRNTKVATEFFEKQNMLISNFFK